MNKFSSFQIILLAVFGALAVAGILTFAFFVGNTTHSNEVGQVVIWGTVNKPTFDSVLEKIIEGNQALVGVSYVQKDASTFDQDLANAIVEKRGPDLYIISSDDALKNKARVTPIPYSQVTKKQYQDAFAEAANPFLGTDGILAVPFRIDPLLLYWNRDLLGSAGYAQPPTQWDQVPPMAQGITVKDTAGSIRTSAISLGTFQNIENAKATLSMLITQAANVGSSVPEPITSHDNEGNLVSTLGNTAGRGSPPAVDALRFYTEFANPAQTDYSWNDSFGSARNTFAQGQVALYVGFASENSLIHAINPNLNYSAAQIPQLPNSTRQITYGRSYGFAIPLASHNLEGAVTVAQLFAAATTSAAFARAFDMAPASRVALAYRENPDQTVINKMALVAKNWIDPDPKATNAIFRAMIEGVDSGAMAIPDAVSQADQKLLHVLRQ